ncbi:MAG: DNA topoisomerase III [Oscillospiraceae bacterium]|nr:DNA topoisomerase III [Oscillospiraceae bacterium]
MAKTLVLAEKPSVGRELARVLGCTRGGNGYMEGDRYIVTWALGHLVTLADPDVYEKRWEKWDMEDLPMLPQTMKLVVIPESRRQYQTVSGLMKRGDVTELIIATDAGREGELVARWIMQKAGWKGKTRRLWISSQTDKAIREGFQNLKPAAEYDSLYRSAQARSEADWLVGLNVTRALTCKWGAQLSAGRVQTPTLSLITRREEEIRRFVPKEYWGISAKLDGFTAYWRDGKGNASIFDKQKAEELTAKLKGKSAVLTRVEKTWKQTPPPAAYDLTELQRDANKKYAYSAKETLDIMQRLYEQHKLLTYPRTDSRYISDDVVSTLPERLQSCMVDVYKPLAQEICRKRPLQVKYLVNNAKVTDHHAIIPTEEQPYLYNLSGPERNIYDLVVRRFLAVLMPPFEYEEVKLTLNIGGETFTARGKHVLNQGWRAAYDRSFTMEEEAEDEEEQRLPALCQGDKLPVSAITLRPGKTKPAARYTEATLLSAMEHPSATVSDRNLSRILEETSGLGTPATRADIIEKLFSSFYIERRGKELVPTSKGLQLVELVPEELRSAEMTARWEDKLAAIAKGKASDKQFVADMRAYATDLVKQVKASDKTFHHDNQTRSPCPECGKMLLKVKGKRGEMLVCPDRECGYRRSITQITNARCPNCHKKMELRGEGEKQMFVCVCGYREKLADFKERRASAGANKREVQKYLAKQDQPAGSSAMADAMARWLEANKKDR